MIYGFHPVKAWQLKGVPGPKAKWLIGNFDAFIGDRGMHLIFTDWAEKHGPLFKASLLELLLVVCPQKTWRTFMTKDFHVARSPKHAARVFEELQKCYRRCGLALPPLWSSQSLS